MHTSTTRRSLNCLSAVLVKVKRLFSLVLLMLVDNVFLLYVHFHASLHATLLTLMQHWGGDCESTFEAMAESLRGNLSLTSSGFAFASHDIGGFEGRPPPEVYHRWVAYGLFSSHSRLHGSHTYRGA
jgi:hypothetical protein